MADSANPGDVPKPRKRRRGWPLLDLMLCLTFVALLIRSFWFVDALVWHRMAGTSAAPVLTTYKIQSGQLGLGYHSEQELIVARDREALQSAVDAVTNGFRWTHDDLPAQDHPSLLRRLGCGYSREFDVRPASFQNSFELVIPLWLLAGICAISPARWLFKWRRGAKAKRSVDPVQTITSGGRSFMKLAIVGAVCVLFGALGMFFAMLHGSSSQGGAPPSAAGTDSGPPIHPIVGAWRIKLDPISATYQFDNDGSFVLTFAHVPAMARNAPPTGKDAGGTWSVKDNELVMTNKWSNTPLTVVGEEESAKIVSVTSDKLVLEHVDRKGKPETLNFDRVEPFVKRKQDDSKIVGHWKSAQEVMSLQPDGTAIRRSKGGGGIRANGCTITVR